MQTQPHPPAPVTAQAPAPTHTTAQAPTHTHAASQALEHAHSPAARASTCVTHKWLIPLEIKPSHALPLCACVTPMHPLHCVTGSNHLTFS
ncbi:hypothetical protein O181_040078 [Austropuccinia psidii MF-1]|uniref:Uncharacterized protein n=1 Tax=Austropuccinia psidii MF-1 TaxID=1389203 RepID=A0A9Q3HCI8_9BASI|nr:hypothetical protein [Austropuccinia psidii MF-1]